MRLILTAAALAMVAAGCHSPPMTNGIPNLHHVEAGVWRGGQPTEAGWLWLAGHGITNVVKLDSWHEGSDSSARELGMTVSAFPINFCEQVCIRPRPCQLEQAVNHIKGGTFVHCGSTARTDSKLAAVFKTQGGQDRTGLVIACYRLSKGWSKQAAEKEMMECGFHCSMQGLYGCWKQQKPSDWKH